MSLVERVKNLCDGNNTTIAALERAIGLSQGSIRHWDASMPSADKLLKVSDYFKISTDYLLGKDTVPKEFILMARKTGELSEKQRERIYKVLDSTIDTVLAAIKENDQ